MKVPKRLKLASVQLLNRTVVEIFKLYTTRKLFSSIHYKLQLSLIRLTHNGGKCFPKFYLHPHFFWGGVAVGFLSKNILWIKKLVKIQNSGFILSDLDVVSKNKNDTYLRKKSPNCDPLELFFSRYLQPFFEV